MRSLTTFALVGTNVVCGGILAATVGLERPATSTLWNLALTTSFLVGSVVIFWVYKKKSKR